jgi:hypothetical protein
MKTRRVVGTGAALAFIAHPAETMSRGGPSSDGEWAVFAAELLLSLLSAIFGWRR